MRCGQPAHGTASVTVAAPDAATADALATAFSVLEPPESLALADSVGGVACLIVTPDRRTFRSRRWPTTAHTP